MGLMITTDLGRHTAEMGRHFQYSVVDDTGLFMQPVAISLYNDPHPRNKVLGDIMESVELPVYTKDDLRQLFAEAGNEHSAVRNAYSLFLMQFEDRLRDVLEKGAERVGKPNHGIAPPSFAFQRERPLIAAFRHAIESLMPENGEDVAALGVVSNGMRLATVYTNKSEAVETALCNMLYNPRLPVKKAFSLDA